MHCSLLKSVQCFAGISGKYLAMLSSRDRVRVRFPVNSNKQSWIWVQYFLLYLTVHGLVVKSNKYLFPSPDLVNKFHSSRLAFPSPACPGVAAPVNKIRGWTRHTVGHGRHCLHDKVYAFASNLVKILWKLGANNSSPSQHLKYISKKPGE